MLDEKLATVEPVQSIMTRVGLYATSSEQRGGFRTGIQRRQAWLSLIEHRDSTIKTIPDLSASTDLGNQRYEQVELDDKDTPRIVELHKDQSQVHMDVIRSFLHFDEDKQKRLRSKMESVILSVLTARPGLNYFQGYHDIVSVIMLALGEDGEREGTSDATYQFTDFFSLHYLRDSMNVTLDPIVGHLRLVTRIVDKSCPPIGYIISSLPTDIPYFALSWMLTLFSHDIPNVDVLFRIFDFFIFHNPAMVAYVCAALIVLKYEQNPVLFEECDDPSMLHHLLSIVPEITLEELSLDREYEQQLEDSATETASVAETEMTYTFLSHESQRSSVSVQSTSATEYDEEEDDPKTSRLFFSDTESDFSIYSDPDVDVPAFKIGLESKDDTHSIEVEEPSTPHEPFEQVRKEESLFKAIYVETLIQKALELNTQYPFTKSGVSDDTSIDAEHILGPRSSVFTWEKSICGALQDATALEYCVENRDIVVSEDEASSACGSDSLPSPPEEKLAKRKAKNNVFGSPLYAGVAVSVLVGLTGIGVAIYLTRDYKASRFLDFFKSSLSR